MKLDFHSRLKLIIGRFLQRKQQDPTASNGSVSRDSELDQSAREYELYYWSSAHGPRY